MCRGKVQFVVPFNSLQFFKEELANGSIEEACALAIAIDRTPAVNDTYFCDCCAAVLSLRFSEVVVMDGMPCIRCTCC